jgi:hypothetical protein
MLEDMLTFYKNLRSEGIIFCFSGPISQSVVEGIGEALRQKMELDETSMGVSQKVFAIFVEQMQNVINYSAEKGQELPSGPADLRSGLMVVSRVNEKFCILSGNYIESGERPRLTAQLERLRSMNKDELKTYYREQRKNPRPEGSKGAGLGFIDTARKASEPLDYDIWRVDDTLDFFCLKAVI